MLREAGRLPSGTEAKHAWRFAALEARNYAYDARLAARLADDSVLTVPLWGKDAGAILGGGAGLGGEGVMPALADMREMVLTPNPEPGIRNWKPENLNPDPCTLVP